MSQSSTTSIANGNPTESSQVISAIPLLGRVLLASIFLLSGISKISAPAAIAAYIGSAGLPFPEFGVAIAVVVEIVGSLALIVGFKTRLAAAVLAVFTIVTALIFHNHLSDQSQFINFFKNVSMTGGLLQVIAFGPAVLASIVCALKHLVGSRRNESQRFSFC